MLANRQLEHLGRSAITIQKGVICALRSDYQVANEQAERVKRHYMQGG
jgi:hypothetical protein